MNLEFTPEQRALGEAVRRLFARQAPAERLRALWMTETGRDPVVWSGLVDIGVTGLLLDDGERGAVGDELDLVLVLTEAGRACLPDELVDALLVGPWLLRTGLPHDVARQWLPALAAGDLRVAVGASASDVVADAHMADLVVLDDSEDCVVHRRDGVKLEPLVSMDPSRRLFRVIPTGTRDGIPLRGEALREGAESRRLVGSAARLGGLGSALLDMTVQYARQRVQFGRPIGSFQGVKHQLAHAHSLNELSARATAVAAALVAMGDPKASDAAAMARICAVQAEAESNRVALQVHGGIGFTWEHDLQLWLKHGKALEQADGASRDVLALVGEAALAEVESRAN